MSSLDKQSNKELISPTSQPDNSINIVQPHLRYSSFREGRNSATLCAATRLSKIGIRNDKCSVLARMGSGVRGLHRGGGIQSHRLLEIIILLFRNSIAANGNIRSVQVFAHHTPWWLEGLSWIKQQEVSRFSSSGGRIRPFSHLQL